MRNKNFLKNVKEDAMRRRIVYKHCKPKVDASIETENVTKSGTVYLKLKDALHG